MNTYRIGFEQIRQDKDLAEALTALERGFDKFSIDFYLVGAVSRDIWLNGIHGIQHRRTTKDVDFAVLINDKGLDEEMREYFITEEKFSPYAENAFYPFYFFPRRPPAITSLYIIG